MYRLFNEKESCPYCESYKTQKNGFGRKGQRRYFCTNCQKSFMGPEDRHKLHVRELRSEIRQKWKECEYEHWFDRPEVAV